MGSSEATTIRARRGRPSRAEQVAARRRALLDAAGEVFRRDGYLAATVDSIAEAAGLTKGAVYSQFESKADLFLTLLEQRIDQRVAAHDALARELHGTASARKFLRVAQSVSRRDPEWYLALLEFRLVAARDPALNVRYARSHETAIRGIVRSLAALYDATDVTPPAPLETLASASLAMEAGGVLEAIVSPEAAPEEAEEAGVALLERLLGFPSPDAPPPVVQ